MEYSNSLGALWQLPGVSAAKTYPTPSPWQPSIVFVDPTCGETWGYVRVFRRDYSGEIITQPFYNALFSSPECPLISPDQWLWATHFKPEHIPTEVVQWNLERLS